MFNGVKVCIFDAYGTLFDIHSPITRISADLGKNADNVSLLWRNKQLQYTWLRSLMKSHADFWQVTSDALNYALSTYQLDQTQFHGRLMDLYMTPDAYSDAKETLTKLRALGMQTGILSNGSKTMLAAAVQSANLSANLDQVISIDDIGVYKPDPRVYQMVPDQFNVQAEEVCFVSSNAWDVAGAAHFGFQVAHINRFSQPPEQLPGAPKAILQSLSELPAIVSAS